LGKRLKSAFKIYFFSSPRLLKLVLQKAKNMETSLYIHPDVQEVIDLHATVLTNDPFKGDLRMFLERMATNLWEAYEQDHPATAIEISNYHPNFLGKAETEILNARLTAEDLQLVIALEYGFEDWNQVLHNAAIPFDLDFEKAVNAVIRGNLKLLSELLARKPSLCSQRSTFRHKAGLIHYVSANGIEIWRQMTPSNIVEVTKLLIDKGADPLMKAQLYGAQHTAGALAATSDHPLKAGVQKQLVDLLSSYEQAA